MKDIWKLREHIAEALLHDGDGCFKVAIVKLFRTLFLIHFDKLRLRVFHFWKI